MKIKKNLIMRTLVTKTFKCKEGDYNSIQKNEIGLMVGKALKKYYKNYKKNPYVSSIRITIDDSKFLVNCEVTIEESPDGRAYIGLASCGASGTLEGVDGSINRAFSKLENKKRLISDVSKKSEIVEIADFNFKSKTDGFGIRQIFILYTNPDTYPYLVKSTNRDFIVGKVITHTPEVADNNGEIISSLQDGDTYSKIMNTLFRRNKSL